VTQRVGTGWQAMQRAVFCASASVAACLRIVRSASLGARGTEETAGMLELPASRPACWLSVLFGLLAGQLAYDTRRGSRRRA